MRPDRHLDQLAHSVRPWQIHSRDQLTLHGMHDGLTVSVNERRDDGFLAGEVLIERAHTHSGHCRNSIRTRPVKSLPHQNASSRLNDRIDGQARALLRREFAWTYAHFSSHFQLSKMRVFNASYRSYSYMNRKVAILEEEYMHATLRRLFQYKDHADDELLTALAGLNAAPPVLPLAIKALSHTYVVDQIFAAHLRRKRHRYTSAHLGELPSLEELSTALRASDGQYVGYVSSLDPGELNEQIDFTFTDGALGRMYREKMLAHVVTHGVGHRGQISAVMLLNSLPPAKDGFTGYSHMAEGVTRRRAAAECDT